MKKQIGLIGLGRMGLNMAIHLVEQGYEVVATDTDENSRKSAREAGVIVVQNLADLVKKLDQPRLVWLMIPSQFVDDVLTEIIPLLDSGDAIIDGGNSFYQDSIRRHRSANELHIDYLDCGTSGGVSGARKGASLMVGGRAEVFQKHEPVFKALATQDAYALVGDAGAGHFVKMVHNGIEYGMMGAIAEGVSLLHDKEDELGIDLQSVFKPYEHGSVITSRLVTWLRQAYEEGLIDKIAGVVPKGETESEMEYLVGLGSLPVLEASLRQRKETREQPSYLGKLVAAMRNKFGGHQTVDKG
ncbi:decarboxylating 6-phosphogluconate dehydrogenase [Candidatus Kaiserbacteria bacterium]|nr:decarboxylating 6-phosphogluconate dehydrogenase [Candidatus Kaiserbacteria bacterium]